MKNIIFLLVILLFSCNSKKETKVVEDKEEQDFEEILKNAKIEDFKQSATC